MMTAKTGSAFEESDSEAPGCGRDGRRAGRPGWSAAEGEANARPQEQAHAGARRSGSQVARRDSDSEEAKMAGP